MKNITFGQLFDDIDSVPNNVPSKKEIDDSIKKIIISETFYKGFFTKMREPLNTFFKKKQEEGNKKEEEEKKEENKKEEEKKDEEKKEEEKKEEDKKEEDKKNVNEEIEKKDIIEKENKEKEEIEKAKHEREIEVSKENTKINQKISIEETKSNVKTKKEEFLDNIKNKSTINSEMKDGFERSIKIKTRTRFYKKHCRLDIPFSEEHAPNSYNINEPYGYIEIRFNCEKDKQEEYFRNKQLVIELDK
jgi:hypothetical protein